jgi:hypothetical protein
VLAHIASHECVSHLRVSHVIIAFVWAHKVVAMHGGVLLLLGGFFADALGEAAVARIKGLETVRLFFGALAVHGMVVCAQRRVRRVLKCRGLPVVGARKRRVRALGQVGGVVLGVSIPQVLVHGRRSHARVR